MSEQPADQSSGTFTAFMTIVAPILLVAFAASFTHMIDWTRIATGQEVLFGVANAVISELLPTASVLVMKMRQESRRSLRYPVTVFAFAGALSIAAQLSSTGFRLPYDRQLLACLPAIAATLLGVMAHAEIEHRRTVRIAAAEQAAREEVARKQRREQEAAAALVARKQAAEAKEIAAREALQQEAERAETAAETAREIARKQAEAERTERVRLAEIEAAERTERERLEAAERAEQRRSVEQRQRREDEARLAAQAERERIEAQATADAQRLAAQAELERARAEAALVEAQAAAQKTAAAQARRQEKQTPRPEPEAPRRMTPQQRAKQIEELLAPLPATTTREEAIGYIVAKTGLGERRVRDLISADYGTTGEPRALRLVAGERP